MNIKSLAFGLGTGITVMVGIGETAIALTPQQLNYLSNTSGIPESGLEVLQTLEMPIAIPTYMPDYMTFEQLELELDDWGSVTYRIVYEGLNEESFEFLCVAIEGTNDGIGDLPDGDRSYGIENEVYGSTTLENGLYGESVIPILVSNWLGRGNAYYRFVGGSFYNSYSGCNDVAVDEAIAITESLVPLP